MHFTSAIKTPATTITATVLAAALCLTGLSACGDKGADSTDKTTTTTSSSAATTSKEAAPSSTANSSAEAAGTVTLETVVGKDTIKEQFPVAPAKVVAMGQMAIDNLLTIGVTPDVIVISAREKDIPWQAGKLDKAEVIEVAGFKDFKAEEIAATHPDLIVGDQWRVTDKNFDKLSSIAPTLGAVPGGQGWIDQVQALGTIYGKETAAQAAIEANEALFATAAKNMPGLKGKTGIISQYIGDSRQFGVVADPTIPGSSFLKYLGMTIPAAIVDSPDKEFGRVTIAAENVSMLDADFMVIGPRGATPEDIMEVPGFSELPQVKDGATRVVKNPSLLQAINQPSALSLAYALNELTPQLEKAEAGPEAK